MTKRAIVADLDRCTGCLTCVVACKEENHLPAGMSFIRLVQVGPEGDFPELHMYYLPLACQQCDRPGCAAACPEAAIARTASRDRGRGGCEVHRLRRMCGGLPLRRHRRRSGDQHRAQVRALRGVGTTWARAGVRGRMSGQGTPDRRRRPAPRRWPQESRGEPTPSSRARARSRWAGSSSRGRSGATSARRRLAGARAAPFSRTGLRLGRRSPPGRRRRLRPPARPGIRPALYGTKP